MEEETKIKLSNGMIAEEADIIRALMLLDSLRRLADYGNFVIAEQVEEQPSLCTTFISNMLGNLNLFKK
jgi:hypothetical protein